MPLTPPQQKRAIGIRWASEHDGLVHFDADAPHVEAARAYGLVRPSDIGGHYLSVDRRYDFDEVLDWLRQEGANT